MKVDRMPRGAVTIVAQGQSNGVALAHSDHRPGHLAVEGHVGIPDAGLDLRVNLASFERDFVID